MLLCLRIITIITSALCLVYVILIVRYCYGWVKTKVRNTSTPRSISVAVVIAARNEEENISVCLDALVLQTFSKNQLQIIVVDDHSEDTTNALVQRYCDLHSHVQLIVLPQDSTGKKNAIAAAIAVTQAELIVTTDADCAMGNNWLSEIVDFYSATNCSMIVAPVMFKDPVSVFEKMQSLEMMALMGSTAGSLYFNKAILCNGANLAYPRSVFSEVNGFAGIDEKASGDDVLLMYKIAAKYPGSIRFLKSAEAIVYTPAKKGLDEFLDQRKRWASKGFTALNTETKAVSLLIWSFSFMLLFMGLVAGFAALKPAVGLPFFEICLIITGIKCIIDFLLLFLAASFFKSKQLLFLFLPEQVIYLFYVVIIGLLGNSKKQQWKGRRF